MPVLQQGSLLLCMAASHTQPLSSTPTSLPVEYPHLPPLKACLSVLLVPVLRRQEATRLWIGSPGKPPGGAGQAWVSFSAIESAARSHQAPSSADNDQASFHSSEEETVSTLCLKTTWLGTTRHCCYDNSPASAFGTQPEYVGSKDHMTGNRAEGDPHVIQNWGWKRTTLKTAVMNEFSDKRWENEGSRQRNGNFKTITRTFLN